MKHTNKIKAFLTVLATTTALSSGFAVTWENGKISLTSADKTVIKNEYGKFTNPILGSTYYLSQFKGELEQKLDTELSHDDFAIILDFLGYGTANSNQDYKKRRTEVLGFLQQPTFTGTWDSLKNGSESSTINSEYNGKIGSLKGSINYTLGQFKGKIEEILQKPISLEAFRSILTGLEYNKKDKMTAYFDAVKPRHAASVVASTAQQPTDAPLSDYATMFPDPPQEPNPYETKVPTGKSSQAKPKEIPYTEMPSDLTIDLDALATSLSKHLGNQNEDVRNLNNVK
ncbi:MAG: hypothetical protein ACRCUQ_01910, partial [Alphaproteobacteria bacterium]